MQNENQKATAAMDTNTTTTQALTPEMETHLQRLKCWRREQKFTEEVMHGLAASDGAERIRLYFEQVIYTVRNAAPEHLVSFMNAYVRGLKDGVQVPDSLEYAVLFQQIDLLKEILDQYEGKPFWQDWMKVYRFLLSVIEGKLTHEEVLKQSQVLKSEVRDQSLHVRLDLVAVTAHRNLRNYEKINVLLQHLSKRLDVLEFSFMKSALKSRMELAEARTLLFSTGDVSKAEKKFSRVIMNNATPSALVIAAYQDRGLSMLNQSLVEQSKNCLQSFKIAMSRAKQFGLEKDYEQTKREYLPFVRNLHGQKFDASDAPLKEQAHQLIVRGENERALYLIEDLSARGMGEVFLSFYKAKALKDTELMSQVRDQFKDENFAYMVPIVDREIRSLDN
ncbi:AimR family lysis-lysogeny pheromone receptor [Shouchella lonarensis]|uniref:Uncharacterized protein n=1 Tax=Shouchella lonarensis TaxID=1464122 RepID=A0A1G6HPL9_9BACI|nr:AimR family lysis-lysogeny pheromone receptor [Shouchella lonarensis]SDB96093.1 hypothetical protein SAMN05421737_104109 [Shouchella lonarensis]